MSLNNEVILDEELSLPDEENIIEAYAIEILPNIAYPEMNVLVKVKESKKSFFFQFVHELAKYLEFLLFCVIISICVILYTPFHILDFIFCRCCIPVNDD